MPSVQTQFVTRVSMTIYLSSFLLLLAASALSEVDSVGTSGDCPIWTMERNGSCECGSTAYDLVQCDDKEETYTISVRNCYCLTADKSKTITQLASCPFHCQFTPNKVFYRLEAKTLQHLDNETCRPYMRTGVICAKCIEGYGLPVSSYSLSCVECFQYKYNWLKYIAVAYIPLTLFYFIVITFRVSATSGMMAGYVTLSQILSLQEFVALMNVSNFTTYFRYALPLFTIWNLDFFRSLYTPFCLHPQLSALQAFMLEYAVALYPLVLIGLTYFAVKLHDRSRLMVRLCKPLTTCFFRFRREWNIRNSLVEAFATFYILSYVKIWKRVPIY